MKKKDIILGILIAVSLVIFISPFAAKSPDGLKKIARERGFLQKANLKPFLASWLPDYLYPGIKNEKLAVIIAGTAGVIIVFILSYIFALMIKKSKRS